MANSPASDLIEEALNQAIRTNEDFEDGDVLVEWVVVAYTANPERDKGSGYPMFYSNGEIPTYRARGLLTTGLLYLELE